MKQVAILAGGRGTRLEAVLGGLPKPMAPIAGKPVLEYQIELAKEHGFDDIVVFAHFGAEVIQDYFGDGSRWGVQISYVIETEPMGTAGCILSALDRLDDRFMVFYADTLIGLDLSAMFETHRQSETDATLFVHPNDHPHDSDLVEIDREGSVTAFHPYPHSPGVYQRNLVNAALYVFEKECLLPFAPHSGKCDFGKDILPALLRRGARIKSYRARGYIKDMGTPERLAHVTADLANGIVTKKGGAGSCGAVFLDRDGTLNDEVNRVSSPEDFALIPGVAEAVREFNHSAIPLIVITNQPVIARGDCTEEELRLIHNKMETLLGAEGTYINDLYYCPHHPDRGFVGERTELKIVCDCRKPSIGLILQASRDWNIDLRDSWMIGDTTTDIQTAKNAGIRSVLIHTGHQGRDGKFPVHPDYEFFTLEEASLFITRDHSRMLKAASDLSQNFHAGEFIALGGMARTGKSTLASLLAEALKTRGLTVKIISTDNWILGEREREGPTVRDRHDCSAITSALTLLPQQSTESIRITMPFYDRKTRKRRDIDNEIVVNPGDVLIVEGVIALDVPIIRQLCKTRIFCHCEEEIRRTRFLTDYRLRGWDEERVSVLYRERLNEEGKIIHDSRSHATIEVETSSL